jgi:hypothetical protein
MAVSESGEGFTRLIQKQLRLLLPLPNAGILTLSSGFS